MKYEDVVRALEEQHAYLNARAEELHLEMKEIQKDIALIRDQQDALIDAMRILKELS